MGTYLNDTDVSLAATLRYMASNFQTETVTLWELFELAGEQGLLLFCSLLTLPFLFPVSIPGISTLFGVVVILIGFSVTLNRVPWLPHRLMKHTIGREHLLVLLEKGANIFDRLEYWIKPRFSIMTNGSMVNRANGLTLTLSGILLVFPLSFIPFSNTLPALAILFFAFGTIQRDGYLIVLGYLMFFLTLIYFSGLTLVVIMGGHLLLT